MKNDKAGSLLFGKYLGIYISITRQGTINYFNWVVSGQVTDDKGIDNLEDLCEDEKIIFHFILKKLGEKACSMFKCFNIAFSVGILITRKETLRSTHSA